MPTHSPIDPFAPVDLTVEFVDSAAGSRKTLTAIEYAVTAAEEGVKTIFAMPTLALVLEMRKFAINLQLIPESDIHEITSRDKPLAGSSVESRICAHIQKVKSGHILFITHEGFNRVISWPEETAYFDIFIDETPEVILSRRPFFLRYSHWALRGFLSVRTLTASDTEMLGREAKGAIPKYNKRDLALLKKLQFEALMEGVDDPDLIQSDSEKAVRRVRRLRSKEGDVSDEFNLSEYYLVCPSQHENTIKAQDRLARMVREQSVDNIFEYLEPIPRWLLQNNYLFTNVKAWDRMLKWNKGDAQSYRRGMVTITGFRRPDALRAFGRVTVMSALFTHTMLHAVWLSLGVRFVPSKTIRLAVRKTDLGKRRLRIYWLSEEGWSKKLRDKSGGIGNILQHIANSGKVDLDQSVCVVVNKDDGSEKNPEVVIESFPKGVVLPHNVRGQNTWMEHHQLIHCAALNSATEDMRWLEGVLGINVLTQRIARTGQEIYQSLMRLSLRNPNSSDDITLVVMDKDVADWLVQWFLPRRQVKVLQIDSTGIIKAKSKGGRPRIALLPLSAAERQRRKRDRDRRS